MNDPENVPINPIEMFAWLLLHKNSGGYSWATLAKETGIPQGTLSNLPTGKYTGDVDAQARRVFKFRQKIESQTERSRMALSAPSYIETPAARRIQFLLEVAQMGRMTVAAMGPGTGKDMTAYHYQKSVANVWIAEMQQIDSNVSAMIARVMAAIGLDPKRGSARQHSNQVVTYLRGTKGLLIVNEANHCSWNALEQLRGWHDATGVGIALLGNEELQMRIKGHRDRHAYARLASRIAQSHIQDMPSDADVEAYLDGMLIDDTAMRRLLKQAAVSGNGGLREVRQILESANMLAIGEDAALGADQVQRAMRNRATSQMRRAA